jgi:hypothetical protein
MMKNVQRTAGLAIVLSALCVHASVLFASPLQHKPQHPLQISIAPAQPGNDLNTIQAGDVVELAATAKASHDAADMHITIKLSDGAELVSGDLSWSGPAVKMEPRSVHFSVRVPEQGIVRIKATVSISAGGKKDLTSKTQYLLMTGKERQEQQKMKASKPTKKDSKGRPIVEY